MLCAMGIKIFPSKIAGDMPGVSKLPVYIHNTKYHGTLVVISGCASKLLKCLILQESLHIISLMVKTCSFFTD